jgi:transposase InsO family protein
MPWKESHVMELRMKFVMRLKAGERMTDLCDEYGISRKTGYKFAERYDRQGLGGLEDASRAPKRIPHRMSDELQAVVVQMRRRHPSWGGRKLRDRLMKKYPEIQWPASSTISNALKRHGLIKPGGRRRRRVEVERGSLLAAGAPNEVWCVDYKGQFRLGNSRYCYPLTITDLLSRYIVAIESCEGTDEEAAHEVFEAAFREYGLPMTIRSDNGTPFSSRAVAGLTVLSAYWLKLGICHQRIEPGHPEQNGTHERMHRTLKAETTRPAGQNALQQQERFDRFRAEFNEERPHDGLFGKTPAELYQVSNRSLPTPVPEPSYPLHDDTVLVSPHGHIRLPRSRQVCLSKSLRGQRVGLREEADGRWLVTFVNLDLGHYCPRTGGFESLRG